VPQLPQDIVQDSYALAPTDASSPGSMVSVLSSSSMLQQQQHGMVARAGCYGSTYGLQATTGLLQLPAVSTGALHGSSSSTVGTSCLQPACAAPCSADADASILSHAQQLLDAGVLLLQDGMLLPFQSPTVQQAGLVQASLAPPQFTSGSAGTYPLHVSAGTASTYPPQFSVRNAGACPPQMTLVNPVACSTQFTLGQASTGPQQLTYTQAPMLCGQPVGSMVCSAAAAPMSMQVASCMPYGVPVAPDVSCTPANACSAPGVIIGYVDTAGGRQIAQQAPAGYMVQQAPSAAGYMVQQQAPVQQGPSAAGYMVQQQAQVQQGPSAAGYMVQQQQFTGACSTGSAPAVWVSSCINPMAM
jgi:hypothetical protein